MASGRTPRAVARIAVAVAALIGAIAIAIAEASADERGLVVGAGAVALLGLALGIVLRQVPPVAAAVLLAGGGVVLALHDAAVAIGAPAMAGALLMTAFAAALAAMAELHPAVADSHARRERDRAWLVATSSGGVCLAVAAGGIAGRDGGTALALIGIAAALGIVGLGSPAARRR